MHHLEMFPATAGTAHNLKELDKRPDTPIAVNPKTRPPPMCPDKKNLGHLSQKMRCLHKHLLGRRPLQNSPYAEPMLS